MEQQIEQLKEQLQKQEKLASLGILSAGIAHEIQNPLNFVINFSKMSDKLLKDLTEIVEDNEDKLPEEDREDLEDIVADLKENINFGRGLSEEEIRQAVEDAMAAEYIDGLDDGLEHEAAIKGANLSGGQKQRLLVARALVNDPEILILDDSSSALDYKTDVSMRKAINQHHQVSTMIMIAQRVSSIMNMTKILVMDNGRVIGYGKHEDLLETCPDYRSIYEIQMESGLSKETAKGGTN